MIASPLDWVVTLPAASRDLITLAAVKAELGLTDTVNDTWILSVIKEASEAIAGYCGREFLAETIEDRHRFAFTSSPFGQRIMALRLSRRMPSNATGWSTSITTIIEDGITLSASLYELQRRDGTLIRLDESGEPSYWAAEKIMVTYSAGFADVAAIPADLGRGCLELVKLAWFARTRDPALKSEDAFELYRFDYVVGTAPGDEGLPASVKRYVDRYSVRPF